MAVKSVLSRLSHALSVLFASDCFGRTREVVVFIISEMFDVYRQNKKTAAISRVVKHLTESLPEQKL